MSYLALARKWRPQVFSEVIGQDHVVTALANALDSERIHHAFLFTGTRGVGKTTLARIFAKALNCESGVSAEPCGECSACKAMEQGNHVDLIEVDAASRTRVDDTRELLDNVQYTPTLGRYKVYLIDEVHMLSTHSFNALLKTLEEPPEHVKFLLATTNPQKLPATILSRCIQFNLKSVELSRIHDRVSRILDAESIPHDGEALTILARAANGSVRDALSLLDQAIAYGNGKVEVAGVRGMLGMIEERFTSTLLEGIVNGDGIAVLNVVAEMSERTVDFGSALDELVSLLHNITLYQVSPQSVEWKGIDMSTLSGFADQVDPDFLQLMYQIAIMGKRDMQYAPDPRTGFEMTLVRMIAFEPGSKGNTLPGAPESKTVAKATANRDSGGVVESRNDSSADAKSHSGPATVHAMPSKPEVDDNQGKQLESGSNMSGFKLDQILDQGGWQKLIDASGATGISREILMNMVPGAVEGNVVSAVLDVSSRHLLNDDRIARITAGLSQKLSLDITLNVTVGDIDGNTPESETPTMHRQRKKKEKQAQAENAFHSDSNVQDLISLFDAEVVADSINPGKADG